MHLAILMTNTDESDFAQRHPKDGEKFARLIKDVRPHWRVSSFAVKDDCFPEDTLDFDGVMITGSPASIREDKPWMQRLMQEIRFLHHARTPLFGACFGHQAIALALGGQVEENAAGWGFGLIEMSVVDDVPWLDTRDTLLQYGAHIEHVTKLPEGARVVFTSEHCPVAGFAIADTVYTTQNHPEMTPDFVLDLVEEYSDLLPVEVVDQAHTSLTRKAETARFAESIARFFEAAT